MLRILRQFLEVVRLGEIESKRREEDVTRAWWQ